MSKAPCPRCKRVIDVDPSGSTSCPECGATGPVVALGLGVKGRGTGSDLAAMSSDRFGGFWIRVLAYLIDSMVLGIPLVFLAMILVPTLVRGDGEADPAVLSFNLVAALIAWLYQASLESSRFQATVGKMAVGLKVTDLTGRRISFARATGRYFASILSGLILLIGYLMIAWTRRKQGLHDRIANTLVYKAAFLPPPDQETATPY